MCKRNRRDFVETPGSLFATLHVSHTLHLEGGPEGHLPQALQDGIPWGDAVGKLPNGIEGRNLTMCTAMRLTMVRLAALAAAAVGIWLPSGLCAADQTTGEVWLISTRRAPSFCPENPDTAQLDYWRMGADRQWIPADQKAFLAGDNPAIPTSFYIHGNRSDEEDAVREGWGFYQVLQSQAPNRPLRYVIWSWPADRIAGRNRYDVQVKACRSDGQSCYLAVLIRQIKPSVPVSLVGYSFGARIITGALHILAGGEVAGQVLPQPDPAAQRTPLRAVLVAAGVDYDWLLPDHYHGLALDRADRVLITVNAADPVLKRYPLMYRRRGPEALGYVGPAGTPQCGQEQGKIELLNVACSVGKTHDWDCYQADPALRSRLARYAFLEPSPAEVKQP